MSKGEINSALQRTYPSILRCLHQYSDGATSRVDATIGIDISGKVNILGFEPHLGGESASCITSVLKKVQLRRHPDPDLQVKLPIVIRKLDNERLHMSHLEDYVAAAVQQTRDEFVRQHPYFFFLLKLAAEERSEEWSFRTRTVLGVRTANGAIRLSRDAERYRVFALVKGSRNPWPERISIGRARNNDVVLPDQSISKLHAHFVAGSGGMALVDAGSRNGTRVNDTKLASGEKGSVRVGDTVVLGALLMTLVDANRLYDLIHKQVTD